MMGKLLDVFFGCWHNRFSFPMTVRAGIRRNGAAAVTGTYVVCLDCGKELPYDWKQMKIVGASPERRNQVQALATKEAA
ncbi:MAG TPA: hypothetical protein VFA74_07930 [Terriglobales bacterium]|nr:hypothetical protein [Terriglobales bacterium]